MLLSLENATVTLLKSALPAFFTGKGAATVSFPAETWEFDPLLADPLAGEPGPEDAMDELAFDASSPEGPYTLTRPPYPGPKRVYLRSATGERVALANGEVIWNPSDSASFSVLPRAGRDLSGFDHLEVHYGVVAAATRLKALYKLPLQITSADPAKTQHALALALAALVLNRDELIRQGGLSVNAGIYQTVMTIKTLKISSGFAPAASPDAASGTLSLEAEVDVRLERLLAENEGKPIARILSPGNTVGSKSVDIEPSVQA